MRRIVLWVMSTVTVVVLLFGYHTSTSSQLTGTSLAAPGGQGTDFAASAGTGATSTSSTTITGPAVGTLWGPVQVRIVVDGGALAEVSVPVYPDGNNHDQEINAYALPILVQETVDAQSARIDMVSGATVTSEGYVRSLQAALDQAGL